MGTIFAFGAFSYAGSVGRLGPFGAVIAWGVSMAAMILISSTWDISLGEWKGDPLKIMASGILVLLIAIIALSLADYFHQMESVLRFASRTSSSCG
jgi:hypothetical protein